MNIGSIYVAVKGDTEPLEKDLDKAKGISMKAAGIAAGAFVATFAAGMAKVASVQDEFAAANSKIAKSLGVSTQEAAKYNAEVSKLYGQGLGRDVSDVAESVAMAVKTLSNNTKEAVEQVSGMALRFEDAYGADRQKSMQAVNVLMTKFGLDAKTALDFVAKGFQSGLDSSGDFLDSVTEYGGKFGDSGLKADEFFSVLKTGLAAGVLGTDKAADMFKEFMIRIVDGSKLTQESLKKIGIDSDQMTKDLASGAKTSGEAFKEVMTSLKDTEDAVVRNQAAVGLLGTQYEDMGDSAAMAIDTTAISMDDLKGSTENLTKTTFTFGESITMLGRELELITNDALNNYGTSMQGLVSDFVQYVKGHHDEIVGFLTSTIEMFAKSDNAITRFYKDMQLISGTTIANAMIAEAQAAEEAAKTITIDIRGVYEAYKRDRIRQIDEVVKKTDEATKDEVKSHKKSQDEIKKNYEKALADRLKSGKSAIASREKDHKAELEKREKENRASATEFVKINAASFEDVYRSYGRFADDIKDIDGSITKAFEDETERRLAPWDTYFGDVSKGWEDLSDNIVSRLGPDIVDDIDVMTKNALDPWTDYFLDVDGKWTTYKDGVAEYKEPIRQTIEEMVEGAKDPWDEFFEEMSWSWDDFAKTASDAMEDIVSNGRSQLSDGFFGLIKGDMDSFSDVWQGFWDDLLRVASDVMAEITIKTAIGGLGDLFRFGSGDSKSSGAGGGILGSLGGTAIGKGAGKVWGWLTGGGAAATGGTAVVGEAFLGQAAAASMAQNAAAGGAVTGSGALAKLGALASNPWTWGIGAALLGGGLIAKNAMTPEKRQSIDDTDFNFFDEINLNSSAANGGGDPMYAELANEAARAAQGDVVRMMDAFMAKVPEQLRDGFKDSLSKMSVHLGGGGMQIREDWLGEDTQVMYQGTLYAMFVDTFDPMIQMMERMKAQYGVDSSAFVEEGKRLQQDFFSFDPEGFWTGEYQTLFNSYYDWFNRVQEYQAGLAGQIDTAVAAQEATIKASLSLADIVKDPTGQYRDIYNEYNDLYRDLGPLTEGYREWETAKIQKEMEEMVSLIGNRNLAQEWYNDQIDELNEKIADAYQRTATAQESIATITEAVAVDLTDRSQEIFREYDRLYRDLGPLTEGYREWETAKIQKEMEEMVSLIGDRNLAQRWYNKQIDELNKRIVDAYESAAASVETGAGNTSTIVVSSAGAMGDTGGTSLAPVHGYASGGVINRLIVPKGEDGFFAGQYGEGVVSRRGMETLAKINSGQLDGSNRPINITVEIDGELLKASVEKYGDGLRVKAAKRAGVSDVRIYR